MTSSWIPAGHHWSEKYQQCLWCGARDIGQTPAPVQREFRFWRTSDLAPGLTAQELAQRAGRSVDAARSAARRHGLKLKPKRRGYPEAVRKRAMARRARGEAFTSIAKGTGISVRTIQIWVYGGRRRQ